MRSARNAVSWMSTSPPPPRQKIRWGWGRLIKRACFSQVQVPLVKNDDPEALDANQAPRGFVVSGLISPHRPRSAGP